MRVGLGPFPKLLGLRFVCRTQGWGATWRDSQPDGYKSQETLGWLGASRCSLWKEIRSALGEITAHSDFSLGVRGLDFTSSFRNVAQGLGGRKGYFPAGLPASEFRARKGLWWEGETQ